MPPRLSLIILTLGLTLLYRPTARAVAPAE